MPSGKTHDKINFIFLFVLTFLFMNVFNFFTFGTIGIVLSMCSFIGFYIGTIYLSPDLDVKSKPFYRWKSLKIIWKPYQKIFSHRSIFTHGILIGDFIRIIYLIIWLLPFYFLIKHYLFKNIDELIINFISTQQLFLIFTFLGITLASTFHIVTDLTTTNIKKIKRKIKKL